MIPILIKYVLPVFFILMVIWWISYFIKRIKNSTKGEVDASEPASITPRQIIFRLLAASTLFAAALAIYLRNT